MSFNRRFRRYQIYGHMWRYVELDNQTGDVYRLKNSQAPTREHIVHYALGDINEGQRWLDRRKYVEIFPKHLRIDDEF